MYSDAAVSSHPIGTPLSGVRANTGPLAAASWLVARGLYPKEPRWFVEVELAAGDSMLRIEIYAEEWGFSFRHGGKESWIRVTDVPFVHGRDDHGLLRQTPALGNLGTFVRAIEERHDLAFSRADATMRTSIADGEPAIRAWLGEL